MVRKNQTAHRSTGVYALRGASESKLTRVYKKGRKTRTDRAIVKPRVNNREVTHWDEDRIPTGRNDI